MSPAREIFITSIAGMAVGACRGTRLFASLMIAQACLESANGDSELSKKHHNYFGIKASGDWHGHIVQLPTVEYIHGRPVKVQQPFRSYASIEDGFTNRIRFLQVNRRYTLNGVFNCSSPEGQAKCFLKAGYATDPAYPQKLIDIINIYDLKQHDTP